MHYIQKHILDELRKSDAMRYVQLNTEEIESGHFRYHLLQLVKDGLVEQVERGLYRLTPAGQHAVDRLSEKQIHGAVMPKVITYTLLRDREKIILYRKPKLPYKGLLNMVAGKVHENESTAQASIREIAEKTDYTISNPQLVGIFEIQIHKNQNLLSHVIAYVYTADVDASEPTLDVLACIPVTDLYNTVGLAPDFKPIFERISSQTAVSVDSLIIHL